MAPFTAPEAVGTGRREAAGSSFSQELGLHKAWCDAPAAVRCMKNIVSCLGPPEQFFFDYVLILNPYTSIAKCFIHDSWAEVLPR